ncbi:MAG: hypothetical protein GEV28_15710 [Actinophytocola sp.]|uniref:hypothetical protein n=1 Tax=Actinophytocola sp. TaxID=1872138 RepID=UPI001323E154|nr:hypothetical protein [Actinophytocola sp.]MPZ81766.1 hypothetical protein [Actinophytocola sp.]
MSVAVASDGSALHHRGRYPHPASVRPLLRDYAAMVHTLTGLRALPLPVHADDSGQLAARLRELSDDIGAIYLTHTDPARARAAQQAVHDAGGPVVVTEQDTTAVTLTAVLLTVLARVDRAPRTSQVVIAGAQTMPALPDLLMAAGIGDIISWNPADRTGFPLPIVTRDADAIIDLLGGATDIARAAADRPQLAVIAPDEPDDHLLAVPGLLRALTESAHPVLTIEVLHGCARAITAATPPARLLPELTDADLAGAVADAAVRELDHPTWHRSVHRGRRRLDHARAHESRQAGGDRPLAP